MVANLGQDAGQPLFHLQPNFATTRTPRLHQPGVSVASSRLGGAGPTGRLRFLDAVEVAVGKTARPAR